MSKLDYIVIVVFTLGVLAAGMSFAKAGKNMKTFFAGGGAVPWWISGLSLFMSFFSAGTFVAWGSLAYMHGWVSVPKHSHLICYNDEPCLRPWGLLGGWICAMQGMLCWDVLKWPW